MNVSELSRKVKINSQELLEILPEFGFDIGKKAIKVDDKIARKIIDIGPEIREKLEADKKAKLEELNKFAEQTGQEVEKKEIKIPSVITVKEFAILIGQPVNQVIKELMKNGVLASLNEKIDFDTASIVADEFNVQLILAEDVEVKTGSGEKIKEIISKQQKKELKERAPVIVVMGHVDHGKTKLLDNIRKANVVEGEAGGITQHIGAYQVEKNNQPITFIDTPGHEAFTAMRSRGAKVADIAILVIAANDSIKPQTTEAIKIIQQSKVPMIVAINKIDLPEADVEKVKKDLSSINLIPEDWGGKTICVPISAKEGLGLDDLLDTILLVYEMEKEKIIANPNTEAVGTIIESHIDKGEGPVATVLVQNGTLRLGDKLCVNDVFFGKARALKDFNNQDTAQAGPSMPVKIIGLKYAPKVGDIVEVKCDIKRNQKKVSVHHILKDDETAQAIVQAQPEKEDEKVEKINYIVKADVLGSLEVIVESIEKIYSPEIKPNVIARGLGNITDADINLADTADAIILGFNVKATPLAEDLAREKNVQIKYYDVIYKLLEELKENLSEKLSPEITRNDLGKLEVLAIFKQEAKNVILGGKVIEGKAVKDAQAEVFRKDDLIASGTITELQSGKQDVNEVAEGQECGINFSGKPEVEVGDILNIYEEKQLQKKVE